LLKPIPKKPHVGMKVGRGKVAGPVGTTADKVMAGHHEAEGRGGPEIEKIH